MERIFLFARWVPGGLYFLFFFEFLGQQALKSHPPFQSSVDAIVGVAEDGLFFSYKLRPKFGVSLNALTIVPIRSDEPIG
jgi:hypothetical protein